MPDFNVDVYVPEDNRYGVNIREAFENRFKPWLWGENTRSSNRVFAITGPFGIGKTWFLRYIEMSATARTSLASGLRKKYTSIYIDWRDAFDARLTPRRFVSQKKQAIESAPHPLCLCVDNIPGNDGASESLNIFEEVLCGALERGAFLVVAQVHPKNRGWSHKIPAIGTEPYRLGEFTSEGCTLVCPNQSDIFDLSSGHPYLTQLLTIHSYPDACKTLIDAWLKDSGLFEERERILKVAYPLSLISSNDPDWPQKKDIAWRLANGGNVPPYWESILNLDIIERLQWLMLSEREGRISSQSRWYLPIQKCLQVGFSREATVLYRELQAALKGDIV